MENAREIFVFLGKGGKLAFNDGYVHFNEKGILVDNFGTRRCLTFTDHEEWHPYEEPKKRYWQWKIKNAYWLRKDIYLNDNGLSTNNARLYNNWDTMEKIKIESDFIDC